MAIAKIYLFDAPSKQLQGGKFPVTIRVTHERKRRYFKLDKKCLPKHWNKEAGQFKRGFPNYKAENDVLLSILSNASDIIRGFERDGETFSFDTFEKIFRNKHDKASLKEYFDYCIDRFEKEGRIGTASPYKTTKGAIFGNPGDPTNGRKKKIIGFCKNQDLHFSDIDYKFLTDFEYWLRTERNCKDTTISIYMRTLRAIFNRAIKEKLVKRDNYPFLNYKLTERLKTETQKRAISKEAVKAIEALELEPESKAYFAQKIFLFSFYTRGMNFIDIANLTPNNIQDGRLNYIRRKTKKPFSIKLLPQAIEILDYFSKNNLFAGDFIFPVFDASIHLTPDQIFQRRQTALKSVNDGLKIIGDLIGMENLKLTTYVGRHSYATTLKNSGVRTSVISEAMGHKSEIVTQTYLKAFENSELDEADENLL